MELTEDEATALATRLSGGRPVTMYPFEFGWLVRAELTPEEKARGQELGHASTIVDRTGVVTVHGSQPITETMEQYAAARRLGRIRGGQIWPPPLTDEEARTLATRLRGGREVTLEPFGSVWVTTEPMDGQYLIVDQTGVATVHSGQSATETAVAYVMRGRTGEIPGHRVFPPTGAIPVEFGWVTSQGTTTLVLSRTGEETAYPGRTVAEAIREHRP